MKKFTHSRLRISLFAILLLCFGKNTQAQRDTGSYVRGGKTIFVNNKPNFPSSGNYTYLWILDATNFAYGGSHTNWPVLKACLDSFGFVDGGHWRYNGSTLTLNSDKSNWKFGKDGSYKSYTMYAIQHGGHGTPKGTIDSLYFTLNKNISLKKDWVWTKVGNDFDSSKQTTIDFNCPVPVLFGNARTEIGDGIVIVYWTTFTENNNEKFEIERSNGNADWRKIGETAGAGNSSQRKDYKFVDNNPLEGINYYRIKQIDYDGKFAYSPIVSSKSTSKPGMEIYPNPGRSENAIVINTYGFSKDNHTVKIYSITGKLILDWDMQGMGNIIYPILPQGIYTVIATGSDNMGRPSIFRQRLTIQ